MARPTQGKVYLPSSDLRISQIVPCGGLILMRLRPMLTFSLLAPCLALAQSSPTIASRSPEPVAQEAIPLFVKVQLDKSVKLSKLGPGDVVAGTVSENVYLGQREILPAASNVHLVVDHMERRRRTPNDHWPWVIKAFTPRHENHPTFTSATVSAAGGQEIPLRVSLVSLQPERKVSAETRKKPAPANEPTSQNARTAKKSSTALNKEAGPVLTLEASLQTSSAEQNQERIGLAGPVTLPAGTQARVILLGPVSASANHAGDTFQTRLIQPVWLDSKVVLPEGTLVQGKVMRSRRPRMLSRAGSLFLGFTGLTLPGGAPTPVEASITEAELDQRSHTRIDPEGVMHGERPGKAWMAINLGVTGGIAKEVDDGLQLAVEAIVSTATDASTAGTARIAATCASAVFMLTRHGRDVVLPRFTELTIVFDRPVSVSEPKP